MHCLTPLAAIVLATASLPPSRAVAFEVEGRWRSYDGASFPYTRWLPDKGKPEAVVIGVHGLSGAASDFEQLGRSLSRRGIALEAFELRGQGNDPVKRRVGDIRSPRQWFRDLDAFVSRVRTEQPGRPVFLYGESLGALIVMHGWSRLAEENRSAVAGLVFASPVVALPAELGPVRYALIRLAARLLPRRRISLLRLAGGEDFQVADGNNHFEQMLETPHYVPRFSLRFLSAVERMVRCSTKVAARIEKPVLVVHAGHDVFTKPADVERFSNALRSSDKTRRMFKDSHHLLFYDKQREELFELVGDWMDERR